MNITDSKMQSQIQKIINDHEKNKRMYRMILVLLFVTGLSILVLLTVNLPTLSEEEKDILFTIPSDTRKISNTAALLKRYSASNGTLILAIFCTSYLFLQTFAIPGTLFLSILSGALWGKFYGMIVTSLCATIGSSFCFILSKTLLKGWVVRQWPKQIIYLHDKIKKQEKRVILLMLFLRLQPVVPNIVNNLVCPLVGMPLYAFSLGTFIGLIPFNLVHINTGATLSDLSTIGFRTHHLVLAAVLGFLVMIPNILNWLYSSQKANQKNKTYI